MAKSMLSEVNSSTQRRVEKKVRKVLLPIQSSDAHEENNMADDKMLPSKEKQTKTKKVKETEKENITARRSKRKAAVTSVVNYIESPDVPKTTKSQARNVVKPKKSARSKVSSAAAKKTEKPTKSNQTTLNVAVNTTEVIEKPDVLQLANPLKPIISTEDSGFDSGPSSVVSNQDPINSTLVFNSPNVRGSIVPAEISIITGGELTLSYWKDLAERREIALHKALKENEELHDQLTVLESESHQLKKLLKDAEHLVEVFKDMIEE